MIPQVIVKSRRRGKGGWGRGERENEGVRKEFMHLLIENMTHTHTHRYAWFSVFKIVIIWKVSLLLSVQKSVHGALLIEFHCTCFSSDFELESVKAFGSLAEQLLNSKICHTVGMIYILHFIFQRIFHLIVDWGKKKTQYILSLASSRLFANVLNNFQERLIACQLQLLSPWNLNISPPLIDTPQGL